MSIPMEISFQSIRTWVETASEHMAQWYMVVMTALALGFVISEVVRILRTARADYGKAKANGAPTWRKRIVICYLLVCAVGEICHRVALVAEAYNN
jgi:hypothetical protein